MNQQIKTKEDEEALEDMIGYMENVVLVDPTYISAIKRCKNLHNSCVAWSIKEECDQNKKFMDENCAPSCRTCHLFRSRKK
mmetsp:Transcript_31200/g.35516  ORF Transcript_31200/g.35516 Transcript_31200/m.35516 type:complete len:81 (+) Transcript_31200:185-427(+)